MEHMYRRIATELLREVVSGRWAAGSALPAVPEIAGRFACSPATAREAIRALEERGIVEVRPGHGQQVLPSDRWNLLDHDVAAALLLPAAGARDLIAQAADAHRVVVTEAAILAARRVRPRDVELLHHQLERMRAARGAGGPGVPGQRDAFAEAEAAFHRTLMLLSGNPVMAAMVASLHPLLAGARRRHAPDRDAAAVRLAERIVAALTARDPAASAAAVDEYGRRLERWIRG
jgi:GntR family transcriptional regulator, transcriptional repressor for pyruvate dehydrogenase complex